MDLGAHSTSLAVKDLAASRAFYEALGFTQIGGGPNQNWLILRNGTCTIGLFQEMFDKNMLTFNPGWATDTSPLEHFDDIRQIQAKMEAAGHAPLQAADPEGTGPAHATFQDPDGNVIFLDQHVPAP